MRAALLLSASSIASAQTDFSNFTPAEAQAVFVNFVMVGTPAEVRALISAGADVNARDEFGATPLMEAAEFNKNPAVIIALLNAGANGKLHDKDGKTAFDYAKNNEAIKGTKAYWRLNDTRF